MRRTGWKLLFILFAAAGLVTVAGCADDEPPLPDDIQVLSIDPPYLGDNYCFDRFCPDPLGVLSRRGPSDSGNGWLISRYVNEPSASDESVEQYHMVEMVRQELYRAKPYDGIDPLSALTYLKSSSTGYKSEAAAQDAFERQALGEDLTSVSSGWSLNIIGYDEAKIAADPRERTTLWVRTGRILFVLEGGTGRPGSNSPDFQEALVNGVLYSMAMLLARADSAADDMVIRGKLFVNGQLVPTTKQDVGGDIVFLEANLWPYDLALDEYYAKADYELVIKGTVGMEGESIELTFLYPEISCGGAKNLGRCYATERITFQPGKVIQTDLHFEKR